MRARARPRSSEPSVRAGLFSEHPVLSFVLSNQIARDDCHKQSRAVYKSTESLRSVEDDAREFQEAIQKNDNYLLRRILYYSGNIVGSSAYWRQVRQKLRAFIDYKDMAYRSDRDRRAAELDHLLAWLQDKGVHKNLAALEIILSTSVDLVELARFDLDRLSDRALPSVERNQLGDQLRELREQLATPAGVEALKRKHVRPSPNRDVHAHEEIVSKNHPSLSRMFANAHTDETLASVMDDRFIIETRTVPAQTRTDPKGKKRASAAQHAPPVEKRKKPPGRLLSFFTFTCPEMYMRGLTRTLEIYRGRINEYIEKQYESVGLALDDATKCCHLASQHDSTSIALNATRGRLARRFPHVTCEYFDFRVRSFLHHVLGYAFDLDDFFNRYEVRCAAPPAYDSCHCSR